MLTNPFLFGYSQAIAASTKPEGSRSGDGGFLPIDIGGLGNFPWRFVQNNSFNYFTYTYINHIFSKDGNGILQPGSLFSNAYLSLLQAIDYKISSADLLKINQETTLRQQQANVIVGQYQQSFGPITPLMQKAAGQELGYDINSLFDYLTLYEVAWVWSGRQQANTSPIRISELANAVDPMALLPNAPQNISQNARGIVQGIVAYWQGAQDLLSIIDLRGAAVSRLKRLIDAILHPSNGEGSFTVSNGTQSFTLPTWDVQPSLDNVLAGLQNNEQTTEVSFQMEKNNIGSLKLGFLPNNVAQQMNVSLDFFRLFTAKGAIFNPFSFSGAGNIILTTKTFKGKTSLNISPTIYSTMNKDGWFDPSIIQAAVVNGVSDVTGYYFSSPPPIDLRPNGPFGMVNQLLVSQFPIVTIKYLSGDFSTFASAFPANEIWNYAIKGLARPGGDAAFPYQALLQQETVGFSVVLHPDPTLENSGSLKDSAYVIGAIAQWLQ